MVFIFILNNFLCSFQWYKNFHIFGKKNFILLGDLMTSCHVTTKITKMSPSFFSLFPHKKHFYEQNMLVTRLLGRDYIWSSLYRVKMFVKFCHYFGMNRFKVWHFQIYFDCCHILISICLSLWSSRNQLTMGCEIER